MKKKIDPNRYYIKKGIRKDWHGLLEFDHKTKFEQRDMSLKKIRLEFARGLVYMIIKSSTGEFLIKNIGEYYCSKPTIYYTLYLIQPKKIEKIESNVSLGHIMGFIELKDAVIYVRTAGETAKKNPYSSEVGKPSTEEVFTKLAEQMRSIRERYIANKIKEHMSTFDPFDPDSWGSFSDTLSKLIDKREIDIGEIVRLENKDSKHKYNRYYWEHEVREWVHSKGLQKAKLKFIKACKRI